MRSEPDQQKPSKAKTKPVIGSRPLQFNALVLTHSDPILKRDLFLVVLPDDADGKELDIPEVIDVAGFRLHELDHMPRAYSSYRAGTLPSACANALTREFNARLRLDAELRRWLIAETFTARFQAWAKAKIAAGEAS